MRFQSETLAFDTFENIAWMIMIIVMMMIMFIVHVKVDYFFALLSRFYLNVYAWSNRFVDLIWFLDSSCKGEDPWSGENQNNAEIFTTVDWKLLVQKVEQHQSLFSWFTLLAWNVSGCFYWCYWITIVLFRFFQHYKNYASSWSFMMIIIVFLVFLFVNFFCILYIKWKVVTTLL